MTICAHWSCKDAQRIREDKYDFKKYDILGKGYTGTQKLTKSRHCTDKKVFHNIFVNLHFFIWDSSFSTMNVYLT